MPELNTWESAYWDGWNDASDLYVILDPMVISPNWDTDERGYWAGWNAKLAQMTF